MSNNIHFKSLECKNLGTVGDMPIYIELDRNVTTAIYGVNGVGKSSIMLDSIMYCLYNKPFKKIKISELVNNKNKGGMEVTVVLFKGSHEYKIVRGYKPSLFEIYMDGNKLPSSNVQQSFVEKEIIGVPYNTFKQIVCMGRANYQSFMDLAKDKRRELVETILDISIFREMSTKHKELVKETSDKLSFKRHELSHKKEMLDKTKKHINSLQDAISTNNKDLIDEYNEKLKALKEELSGIDEPNTDETTNELKELVSKRNKAQELKSKISSKQATYKQVISFLNENDTCPTCKQIIHSDFKEEMLDENITENDKLNEMMKSVVIKLDEFDDKISTLENTLNSQKAVDMNIMRLNNEISRLVSDINNLMKQDKDTDSEAVKTAKNELKDILEETKELSKEISDLEDKTNIQSDVSKLLSDSGIKTIVINKYLPTINSLINKNLNDIGLFANIKFDEEFKDEIKKRGFDDFSYNQLSEGEKLRVDLSIMMAWRDIAAIKSNLSINLLIMDDLFNGSMDYNGCKAFIDMLNSMEGKSSFIISPDFDEILDLCHSSIKMVMKDGFVSID